MTIRAVCGTLRSWVWATFAFSSIAAAMTLADRPAQAAEPPECLSSDPSQWPAPSRPYFMVGFDTSGSMTTAVNASNSCGYPNDRLGHGRCALKNTLLAYAGEANFGLSSYARVMTGCSATCFNGCIY